MSKSPIAVWDFRYNADVFAKPEELRDLLKGVAKSYVFQLEEGDTGYRHFQGRLSLIKKRRHTEKHLLLKLFKGKPPNYLEPTTSSESMLGEAFYMTKEDTRISGPYRDDDEIKVITKQLQHFQNCEMYNYQRTLHEISTQFDMRKIDIIYDL